MIVQAYDPLGKRWYKTDTNTGSILGVQKKKFSKVPVMDPKKHEPIKIK